jgi:hypothetical protein
MPNGDDKNLRRLQMACAVYRQKYGAWPTQARFGAFYLWNLAGILDDENFARLASRLELRTSKSDSATISVGGVGVVVYEDVDHSRLDSDTLDLAVQWLGVEARHHERG